MESPKTGTAVESPKSSETVKVDLRRPLPAKESRPVEILELSLEDDIDLGNDPYNNTGEKIILKVRENAKR